MFFGIGAPPQAYKKPLGQTTTSGALCLTLYRATVSVCSDPGVAFRDALWESKGSHGFGGSDMCGGVMGVEASFEFSLAATPRRPQNPSPRRRQRPWGRGLGFAPGWQRTLIGPKLDRTHVAPAGSVPSHVQSFRQAIGFVFGLGKGISTIKRRSEQ